MLQRKVIYDAPQEKFFEDVLRKKLADIMKSNFKELTGREVPDSEYRSWDKSLGEIKNLIELSGLKDIYVSFEYQLPYSQKRIDCFLFGKNKESKGLIVHIELKQWEKVEPLNTEGNFVETYTGGDVRKVAHPSQQVEGYHEYLLGFVEAFEEKQIDFLGCSYCHNYRKQIGEGLFDPRYQSILEKYPVYTRDDVEKLAKKLKYLLYLGQGFDIFNKFMLSPIKPSKKLLENVSKIVEDKKSFSLINEQIYAKNVILDKIKKAEKENEKSVIIVRGGPGTGKTVIALHIIAELAAQKKQRSIFFSTKSKPLLEAIKEKVGKSSKLLFTNLNQFIPSKINENMIDVLIIDEAHRIGKTSNHQFTRPLDRTDVPQIDQLIRCAKTSVFFIDDKQIIRSLEIGSTNLIKETANKFKCSLEEVELPSQFRCNGSDNYIDWLEYVLGHSRFERKLKHQDNFDFKIVDSPNKLYELIKNKNLENGNTARIVAGFCWPWSKSLDRNGDLVKDVKIKDFEMPWETHGDISRPPKDYVSWYEWAYKPEGIKQVGCIYTAQGFEFDYIGVIVGPDLKYDKQNDCLIGNPEGTKDPVLKRNKESFTDYVRNIYRVLMSRGMKGCYVYFVDKEVENYFKRFIEQEGYELEAESKKGEIRLKRR